MLSDVIGKTHAHRRIIAANAGMDSQAVELPRLEGLASRRLHAMPAGSLL